MFLQGLIRFLSCLGRLPHAKPGNFKSGHQTLVLPQTWDGAEKNSMALEEG